MTSPITPENMRIGQIFLNHPDSGLASALPLEHTAVTAQLSGPSASVLVEQRFGNPLEVPAELEYLFPLPQGGAVIDFALRIGPRTVRGDLQEIKQARASFREARESGERAGLLELRRPNLFGLQLTNVQPGETIQVEIRYQERLTFSQDGYEWVFPMGLTPKYDSPTHPEEGEGVHAPIAARGEAIGTVEIQVAVDSGVSCSEPASPSHSLEVTHLDERRFLARIAGEQIPDHDFVLRYAVAAELPGAALWTSPHADGAYFLASILPPRPESDPEVVQREFIFVLDRSGSMSGEPILQARNALRACLRALGLTDTFRILLFDDQMDWYLPEAAAVTQAAVDQADAFLDQVDARGGTEIVPALEAVLSLPVDPERTRFVVFLTDGAVSAEARLLVSLRKKLGSARVFTFGIGSSVNRALLASIARLGRGAAEFLQDGEDIEEAIIRFQDRVSFPALTDISLRWQGAKAWDIYPEQLPDLYIGQPLQICGRIKAQRKAPPVLLVSGRRGGQPFEVALTIGPEGQPDPVLARLWARARVDSLLEEAALSPQKWESARTTVIGLALEHRLVTEYTAFVALDDRPAGKKARKPVQIQVAQPLVSRLDLDEHVRGLGQSLIASAASMSAPMPRAVSKASSMYQTKMMPPAFLKAPAPALGNMQITPWESLSLPSDQWEGEAAPAEPLPPARLSREEQLRLLGRTQRLDGSWAGDVEQTAAALLAFVRGGQTPVKGQFRRALRQAVSWLALNSGSGFACFARMRALRELAEATLDPRYAAQAAVALAALPPAVGPLELAFCAPQRPAPAAGQVTDLDGLRLAALAGGPAVLAAGLGSDELVQVWSALLY